MTTFALIIANPNSDEAGSVCSKHRNAAAAHRARHLLPRIAFRWAFVAERRTDGSYPNRVEGMTLAAHTSDYA